MPELANVWVGVGADLSEFQKKMGGVGKRMRDVGKRMTSVGSTMSKGLTLPIVAAGAGVVSMAADFQSAMNEVQAVTQPTTDQLAEMEKQAKKLGRTTQFSASEAAEGMVFLGRAGLDAQQQIEALPGTLDLAAAGGLDLARASDIATDVMSGFGMEVSELSHLNDVLAQTASSANTDIQGLGAAMAQVAPVAAASGVSVEETSAAVGLLASSGIKASRAGTQLRAAIAKMEKQSGPAKDAMQRLGVSFEDAEGNTVGLAEAVQRMNDAGATTGDVMTIFGRRAGTAISALMEQGAPAVREFTGELGDAQGRAAEMAKTKMQGLPGALKKLKSAFEGMALAIADSGVVDMFVRIARGVTSFMRSVAKANPTLLKVGVIIAGIAAAIGPVVIALGAMTAAAGALLPVIAAISAPVVAIVAGLAALAAGLAIAYAKSETFRSVVQTAFAAVKTAISTGISVARAVIGKFVSWAQAAWQRWGADIIEIARRVWNIVSTAVQAGLTAAKAVIGTVTAAISALWQRWGSHIVGFLTRTWDNVKSVISGAVNIVLGVVKTFLAVLQGDWQGAWDGIKQILRGAWQVIKGVVGQAINVMSTTISAGLAAVKAAWNAAWNVVTEKVPAAWEAIKAGVSAGVDALLTFFRELPGRVVDALSALPGMLVEFGKDVIRGLVDGVKSMAGWLGDQIMSVVEANVPGPIKDVLGIFSPSRVTADLGVDTMRGLQVGIESKRRDLARTVASVMPDGDMVARVQPTAVASAVDGRRVTPAGGDGAGQAEVVDELRRVRGEVAGLRGDVADRPTRGELRDAVRAGASR